MDTNQAQPRVSYRLPSVKIKNMQKPGIIVLAVSILIFSILQYLLIDS